MDINIKSLISKLDNHAKSSLEAAAGYCLNQSHYNVEIEHYLYKLIENDSSSINILLKELNVDSDEVKKSLNTSLDHLKTGNVKPPALSVELVELLKEAWTLSSVEFNTTVISGCHILTAILCNDKLRRQILPGIPQLQQITPEFAIATTQNVLLSSSELDNEQLQNMTQAEHASALDKYTINLTQRARNNEIDPVLGRDQEIRQIIDVLSRRRQNNPILTGEAGVGKTAVVEGFALRIINNDVPETLRNIDVRVLDLGLLQAGASIKGEFENRLKSVIEEVKASPKPIIMFIDEAHTLIGAGGKEGQGDAANLLKPALARGEFRTIAATTWAEYKKYFERDPALTRRFQVVKVNEPDEKTAIEMMRGICKSLQDHHKVNVQEDAIIESVRLSAKYLPGRQLPDKSVSLLDTACARVSLSQTTTPSRIEELNRFIVQAQNNIDRLEKDIALGLNNTDKIKEIISIKEEYIEELSMLDKQWENEKSIIENIKNTRSELELDYLNTKSDNKDNRLSETKKKELQDSLHTLTEELNSIQTETALMQSSVTGESIAEVISNWTGIPVGKMVSDEINSLLELKSHMEQRVIGQSHALDLIAKSIQTSRAGLTDPRKPVGIFLMVGPSGVGKTETAVALADILYGGEQNMTVINMSEFKEEHKVSMLLGSPPGYVGYGEGGVLTEAVRRNPHSIILLDEMEKAHPGVQDVFYQLFDKGTIKDGEGRDIDFKNTIIIMTSNAGEEVIRHICEKEEVIPEYEDLLEMFRPALSKYFKPAFLGRTQVVPYYPLEDEILVNICELNMKRIENRITDNYGAHFSYNPDVPIHIVARSQEVDTGARNIEKIISKTLLPELATECLSRMSDDEEISSIHIDITEDGEFNYSVS